VLKIISLHSYPVKSGRGIDLASVHVETMGLSHDRQWMIIDEASVFLTLRDTPELALLMSEITETGDIILSVADNFTQFVKIPSADAKRRATQVWGTPIVALDAGDDIAHKLSIWLQKTVRLVRVADARSRLCNLVWAGEDAPVGFADGYPILIALTESLEDLNAQLQSPVPMTRFRPNIVISGAPAWADDGWLRIKIGAVELELVKPCVRCLVITTDALTGARMGSEPLTVLAKIRRSTTEKINGVLFGTNAVPRAKGQINVGDPVSVLETREPWGVA
jgi:uncharacterized protein